MCVDSDETPVAVLLQGADEIAASMCGQCCRPAEEWPRVAGYHPIARPGVMYQAELYCSDCRPRGHNGEGSEVRSFCGIRHAFTDGEGINCGCFR